jgi:t-SNARE complex subunit (syntaxin)
MTDIYSEKQPLTATGTDFITPQTPDSDLKLPTLKKSPTLDPRYYENFVIIAKDIRFNIEESLHCVEKIKEAQKAVYEHATSTDNTARENRAILETQTAKVTSHLDYMRRAIISIEPSKPKLSDLDLRNQQFKLILRSYKDLLEKYINITLESQRFTSVLFENQIKAVNPHATSFDLERAISSTGEDCPSVFVQVLMQRGVRTNDKKTKHIMHVVQDIHQDLRQLALTFTRLSEMRNEANILIERYRRRWPIILREGDAIYIIDDNLDMLEQNATSAPVDFNAILRQHERRKRIIASLITLATAVIVIGIVVSTSLFSDF